MANIYVVYEPQVFGDVEGKIEWEKATTIEPGLKELALLFLKFLFDKISLSHYTIFDPHLFSNLRLSFRGFSP
jgi:hypothetical protein